MNENQTQQTQVEELLVTQSALKLFKKEIEKYNTKAADVCTVPEFKIIQESLNAKYKVTQRLLAETDKKLNSLINGKQ